MLKILQMYGNHKQSKLSAAGMDDEDAAGHIRRKSGSGGSGTGDDEGDDAAEQEEEAAEAQGEDGDGDDGGDDGDDDGDGDNGMNDTIKIWFQAYKYFL